MNEKEIDKEAIRRAKDILGVEEMEVINNRGAGDPINLDNFDKKSIKRAKDMEEFKPDLKWKIIFIVIWFMCLAWILIMTSMAFDAKALTIETVPDVSKPCSTLTPYTAGCYQFGGGIYLMEGMTSIHFVRVLLHELGHFYTQSADQMTATNYGQWLIEQQLEVVIEKPYIRYYGSGDVYFYDDGGKVSYEYAVENDIWDKVQDMPFRNRLVAGNVSINFK